MKRFLLASLSLLLVLAAPAQWKAYLSYYEPTEIEQAAGNTFYVLASGGLYSYNTTDRQLITYDKTTVLSDCGIAHIAWCQAARRLVVVYDNYNIDLLSPNGNVVNMPAYMNTSMTVDKTVNRVDVVGNSAYLSTNFGIIKLNVANAEFSDTYQLGFAVDYCYTDANYIYAASPTNGLYRAPLSANLLDPNQWQRTADYVANPKTMDADLLATVRTLSPGGPKYNHFGTLNFKYNNLYTVGGGFSITNEMNYPACVQVWDGNDWIIYEDSLQAKTGHDFVDFGAVDVDPNNHSNVYAAGRTGLYLFNNGRYVQEFTVDNSPLRGAATVSATNKDYTVVQGISFDSNGHLWVANSISATTNILEYNPASSEWTSHYKSALLIDGARSWDNMKNLTFDHNGVLWFVNDNFRTPALARYVPSTDNLRTYESFVNEDGTDVTVQFVRCVAEDKDYNIWIGTNQGPLVLDPTQATADSPVFTQVKVPRNDGTDYADYLLSGVDITSIVVDNANRKWFGTSGSGVYLIASDNITQLQHFTKDNSPLLSNNVESLALNSATGELFIGTSEGLCSYTSTIPNASEGMTKDNVYAYPNPVRPDYQGAITITGLDEGAYVKIVTSNGTLVNEGAAANGQYRWYGIDHDGRRVTSGVYMVEVSTAEGEKGVVCKIAIVR